MPKLTLMSALSSFVLVAISTLVPTSVAFAEAAGSTREIDLGAVAVQYKMFEYEGVDIESELTSSDYLAEDFMDFIEATSFEQVDNNKIDRRMGTMVYRAYEFVDETEGGDEYNGVFILIAIDDQLWMGVIGSFDDPSTSEYFTSYIDYLVDSAEADDWGDIGLYFMYDNDEATPEDDEEPTVPDDDDGVIL